ncbi:MAG: DUF3842 family protein [Oscillospiraceae bacterium]|nr:DUF3842 family protein [Oscillospiraceae bacterium]
MKIVVIDGQGGKIGSMIIEKLLSMQIEIELTAIGTNSIATANMLKAGAAQGATGENSVVVNSRTADIIIGPIGIIAADALLGEVTPVMATAISGSRAKKILIPLNLNKCNFYVAGVKDLTISELISIACEHILTK